MMKSSAKRILLLLLCCILAAAGSGCGKKEMTNEDILKLDWSKIANGVDDQFVNDQYPNNISVNYNLDTDNSFFQLVIIVEDTITKEEAAKTTEQVIKGINDMIHDQNKNFKKSGAQSFGGFYQNLDLYVQVIPRSPYTEEENYIVNQKIPAGEYQAIDAKEVVPAAVEDSEGMEDETAEDETVGDETDQDETVGDETAAEDGAVAEEGAEAGAGAKDGAAAKDAAGTGAAKDGAQAAEGEGSEEETEAVWLERKN